MLDLPKKLAQYQILGRIALGGMAEVFKAVSRGVEGFEKVVAIKRILPHVAEDEEFITMFKDEARIAAQLQHSNIAQIFELKSEGDSFYIVLEYVPGKDLRAMYEHGRSVKRPMPLAQVCYIIMQVCEGLDYAHNKKDRHGRPLGLIHRDVSPPNVLVSYEGEVKLIDFGVAKAAGRASQTQAGILKGKFGYMSPEQVRGASIDRRSDIFSLGAVMWEILCNQRLFQAETDFATLEKVRTVNVEPPSRINPAVPNKLEQIVMRALHADLNERYQSASELHDALQAFMFEEGLFYSRKNLAEWMQEQFAKDIEAEKERARQVPPAPPPSNKPTPRKTMMNPGSRPPPPPPGGGKPPPPPPGRKPPPPKPKPGRSRQSSIATEAHPSVASLGEAAMGKRRGPPKPGRPRAKTMVMTNSKPDIPGMGKKGPARPKPPARAGSAAPAANADFDWDDDELETRLFEGQEDDALAATPDVSSAPDSAPSGPPPGTPMGPPGAMPPGGPPSAAPPGGAARSQLPTPGGRPPGGGAGLPTPGGPRPAPGGPPGASPAARAPTSLPGPGGGPPGGQGPSPGGPPLGQPLGQPPGQPPGQQGYGGAMPQPQQGFQQQPQSFTAPQQQVPQQQPQQQYVPPSAPEHVEANKKSNVGLIIGLVIGVVAILGGVGFFVIGPGFGGGDDDKKTAEAKEEEPTPAVGSVSLEVTPADAMVKIDGKEYPGGSPRVIPELEPGSHKLEVSQGEGFVTHTQDINIISGQTLPVPVELQPRNVTLLVKVEPDDAVVSLLAGDKATEIGKGKSAYEHKLVREDGVEYTLAGEAQGYEKASTKIAFDGQATQELTLTLSKSEAEEEPEAKSGKKKKRRKKTRRSPPKAKTSELKIGVAPGNPPATVYVDNKKQSKKTPVFVKVTPGSHRVKWKWGDGKTSQQSVRVKDGESKLLKGAK